MSADHFAVFGVQPQIGRTFRPEEDQAGAPAVVILSHAAWQTYFGGDAAILNRELLLDNEPHRVIGVLPAGAFDRHRARPMEEPASFWRLNAFTAEERAASSHWLNPLARLKPGVSIEQAHADLLAVRAQIADTIPAWKKNWSVAIEPFDQQLVGDTLRQSIVLALGAVALVLLIACANLTNLLLSRGAARRKEIAVRAALGASRGRLVTQLLTESLVLGALGGMAGVALAAVLIRTAVPLLPLDLPFTADVALNWRVLAFASAVALAVSALVGVLPALRLSAGPPAEALNNATRGSSGQHDRLRRVIVVAEVAVSLVLICGSVLLFKSLLRMQSVDIGARVDRVLTMSIVLPWSRYPDGHHWAAFYPMLMERVRAIPGIESASISGDVPLEGTGGENLRMPGREERLLVRFKRADASYFSTMGIPVREGRGFTRGRSRRNAVRRGRQRSTRRAAARHLRRARTCRHGGRSPAPRLRTRSPRHHDDRRRHRQRACPERPARAERSHRVRADRAGAADADQARGADTWRGDDGTAVDSGGDPADRSASSRSPTSARWNRSGTAACPGCANRCG